jgi:hypothetical protein
MSASPTAAIETLKTEFQDGLEKLEHLEEMRGEA